jgi:hypothetical protein
MVQFHPDTAQSPYGEGRLRIARVSQLVKECRPLHIPSGGAGPVSIGKMRIRQISIRCKKLLGRRCCQLRASRVMAARLGLVRLARCVLHAAAESL